MPRLVTAICLNLEGLFDRGRLETRSFKPRDVFLLGSRRLHAVADGASLVHDRVGARPVREDCLQNQQSARFQDAAKFPYCLLLVVEKRNHVIHVDCIVDRRPDACADQVFGEGNAELHVVVRKPALVPRAAHAVFRLFDIRRAPIDAHHLAAIADQGAELVYAAPAPAAYVEHLLAFELLARQEHLAHARETVLELFPAIMLCKRARRNLRRHVLRAPCARRSCRNRGGSRRAARRC